MTSDNPLTYLCIENYTSTIPENSHVEEFKISQQGQLKQYIKKNKTMTFVLLIDSIDKSLVLNFAMLAFQLSQRVQINGFKYDFRLIGKANLKDHSLLVALVAQAKEAILFEATLCSLVNDLSNKSPLLFSEETAIKIIEDAFVTNHHISGLNESNITAKEFATEYIKQSFTRRKQKVKRFISPDVNENVVEVEVDFEKDLINFIGSHPGIIVLNGGVGSGKTKNGIIPCFEYFCSQNQKPILITPLIALTQKLVSDNRNYKVAQEKNILASQPGIASCVDTVVTNRDFIKYNDNSNVSIIDEYGECLNVFAQKERIGGSLTARAVALEEFFKLLNKPQVIIADALFSDLSAKQLVRMTGKKIFLLSNINAVPHKPKTINIVEEKQHIANLICERKSGDSIAVFNDSSQKNKKASLAIFNTVTGDDESIGVFVNASFLKKKRGKEYLANIDEELTKVQIHQFSPSITSGHSFEKKVMHSVNIISNKTTLPTQVIQSSSRFRLNEQIHLSFINPFMPSEHETSIEKILQSIVNEELVKNSKSIRSDLISSKYVLLIAELIKQNNEMRNNYCSNTIMMFEILGLKINNLASDELSQLLATKAIQIARTKISEERFDQFTDIVISEAEYVQLQKKRFYCSDTEQQKKDVYEFVIQYSIQGHHLLNDFVLCFDNYGKGFEHINNYKLLIGELAPANKEDTIKLLFLKKIVEVLKLKPNLSIKEWSENELTNINTFFKEGVFFIQGKAENVKDLFEVIFPYTKISDSEPITAVRGIFKNEFGLILQNRKGPWVNGSRPYIYWVDKQQLRDLSCMSDILSNDIVKSKLGLLKLYKIEFPALPIDERLSEEVNISLNEIENELNSVRQWVENHYDYPFSQQTYKAIYESDRQHS